jgi:hypothetical protein
MSVSAFVILSDDKCDLFDCCSIVNIVNYSTPELNKLKASTLQDFRTEIGKINFTSIVIQNSSSVKVCGKIDAMSNNYWGIKDIWNSTWWNSSYTHRYKILTNFTEVWPVPINQTLNNPAWKLAGDIVFAEINNLSYVYCTDANCTGSFAIATTNTLMSYHNVSSMVGSSPKNVFTLANNNCIIGYHFESNITNGDICANNYVMPLTGSQIYYTNFGKIGGALGFSARSTNTYYLGPDYNYFDPAGDKSQAISVWFNVTTGQSQYQYIGGKNNAFLVKYKYTSTDEKIECSIFDGGWHTIQSATTISGNTWYHVVCNKNATGLFLYLNGVFSISDLTATNEISQSANGFFIGKNSIDSGDGSIFGQIDEFYFFNRSLTDKEIKNFYFSGIGNMTAINQSSYQLYGSPAANINIISPNNTTYTGNSTNTIVYNITLDKPASICFVNQTSDTTTNHNLLNFTGMGSYNGTSGYSVSFGLNTTANYRVIFYCNETEIGNWSSKSVNFSFTLYTPPIIVNISGIEYKFCNGTNLTTLNKYNEYTNSYVNVVNYCNNGCDSNFLICSPPEVVVVIIVLILFGLFIMFVKKVAHI